MAEKKKVIVLTGPTAVGKTALSISLAKAVNAEIISADSMQVYKHMDIGTAKIMPEEMQGIKHFLVDELEPNEDFSVVRFQQMAKEAMQDIWDRGKIPLIVGGTGFYIQAILNDIDFTDNEKDDSYRNELEELAQTKGAQHLHDMLKNVDPKAAEEIHAHNVKRVIRALEYFEQTGERISEHNDEQKQKESPYNFCYFVLNDDREILYERINRRIDLMLEHGLVKEVEKLQEMGYDKTYVSMQGLGYKEILDYLNGSISLEEAVYILKRDTRHFAKRQLTWFRREKEVEWMNYQDYQSDKEKMLAAMLEQLRSHKII